MKRVLIGRKYEQKELKDSLSSNQPEFIAVVGRRRVGKTFLIKQTFSENLDFELTGLQHANKSEQIQNLVFALKNYFPDFDLPEKPQSWLEAFFILSKALESLDKKEKMVIFLDELPWLGTKKSGFITGLGWFWNSWAINQNITLIICGSAASWMIEKVINDKGGLHNRITKLISLKPFTLYETEAFLRSKNINPNQYQITQIFMTMGGIPMYLDQVKPGLSAIQNIQEICFKNSGYLRNEFDRLFTSLFFHADNHIAIIRALASKRKGMTRSEIITKSKIPNGGMLSGVLHELEQSGFIERYQGYGKKSRTSLYRLTDPYSLFYLTFIESIGPNRKIDFTKLSDLPNYKTWSGYAFENICLTHIDQIRKALGIAGIFTSISSFFAKPMDNLPGSQIDLIIDRSDQSINICEIKFSNNEYLFSKADVENLETKKKVFAFHSKTKKHLFSSLITTFGVIENSHKTRHLDHIITLNELFQEV